MSTANSEERGSVRVAKLKAGLWPSNLRWIKAEKHVRPKPSMGD